MSSATSSSKRQKRSWKQCSLCASSGSSSNSVFKSPAEFSLHLRQAHCTKEGGSFVCRYGYNGVCSSLPVEGVSDRDYEDHVARHHVFNQPGGTIHAGKTAARRGVGITTPKPPSHQRSVSVGGVDNDQVEWNVYSSTLNLPAVLNDPGRGKERDLFSKTWGDAFVEKSEIPPCPYLPVITRAHFEDFLKKISKRYKRHLRRTSSGSGSRAFAVDGDQNTSRKRLQAASRSLEWSQANLDHIPKIFLQPNFSLENLDTFNAVFSSIQLGLSSNGSLSPVRTTPTSTSAPSSQQSTRILQEKLSHYLDSVEVQIARHISLKSEAFFHAMTSHDALMEQLTSTVQQVKKLRARVHQVDAVLVGGSFNVMRLRHRYQMSLTVYRKLKLMSTVHQTQPTIQLLLSTSDFVGALDLIGTTQEVLDQELADIHCFKHLGSQLAELEKVIEKMMLSDFARYATADLNRPLGPVEELVMEEERLVAIVLGMLRLRRHEFINIYNEEVFATIKAIVKQTVVKFVGKVGDVESEMSLSAASLADQMRLLDFDSWMALVKEVLQRLLQLLRRIQAVQQVICGAVNQAAGHTRSSEGSTLDQVPSCDIAGDDDDEVTVSEEDHARLTNALEEMLVAACDHADDRSAKLFTTKSKGGFFERLCVADFVWLSKCVDDFVVECEAICGKRSTNLQLALQSQAHRFVGHFHDERKTKLSLILDSERWKQADVPAKFQRLVDHICSSDSLSIPKNDSERDNVEEGTPEKFLVVKGEKFAVIGTVLILLNMLVEYCDCVRGIPFVASDLLTRLVELLKTFNSRSCQLVLGAGALQLVGLKTITTKNLALASRCLQLIAFFIPKMKNHFEKHLNAKQQNVSRQLDQTLKDFNDHIQEITNKLVFIMENMFEGQLSKWEVKPPVPSPCFRSICKQLSKLHEAIADVLPSDQVQKLFLQINRVFKKSLKKHLQKLNVLNDGGPQHGLVTSELAFYLQSLKSIQCVRSEEDLAMNDIWVVLR